MLQWMKACPTPQCFFCCSMLPILEHTHILNLALLYLDTKYFWMPMHLPKYSRGRHKVMRIEVNSTFPIWLPQTLSHSTTTSNSNDFIFHTTGVLTKLAILLVQDWHLSFAPEAGLFCPSYQKSWRIIFLNLYFKKSK